MQTSTSTSDTNTIEPEYDENRPLTAREIALNAIKARRDDSDDEQQEPTAPAQVADTQLQAQMDDDPQPRMLADGLDKTLVRVKIDGEESEVSVEEMVRQYQKNGAADRRLAEANRLLEEARRNAAQVQPPPVGIADNGATGDSTPTPSGGIDEQGGKAFLAALFDGDEDRALQALGQVLGGRQQPTLNESDLVAKLTPQIRQQLVVESALEQFNRDFADVMADPYLEQIAADATQAAMVEGKPFAEALVQGGKSARDWLASKGVKPPANPAPTMDRSTKLGRKASMDNLPALSKTATTTEDPPQTASDVIAEMRRQRGLG